MNDHIRAAVQARLDEMKLNRANLAQLSDKTPEQISRALNNTGGRGGKIPEVWASIFDALDLELTVKPKE